MDSLQWQSFLKSCLDILRNGESKFDGLKAINEFINRLLLVLRADMQPICRRYAGDMQAICRRYAGDMQPI